MKLALLTALVVLFLCISTPSQGFPWNDFGRRTLADIVKIDEREIADSEKQPRIISHADKLLSVVRVKYSGKSRPISPAKMDAFKKYWLPVFCARIGLVRGAV
jgi:hypothetical protein